MSKLKQVKINLDLNEEVYNWKLVREGDGLTRQSKKIMWLEWDDEGRFKAKHNTPAVGYSLLMSPFNEFFTWQTTTVTEILYAEEDGSLRFRTKNSVYTLTKINNEQQ
jgi:glutamate 5-kinase